MKKEQILEKTKESLRNSMKGKNKAASYNKKVDELLSLIEPKAIKKTILVRKLRKKAINNAEEIIEVALLKGVIFEPKEGYVMIL